MIYERFVRIFPKRFRDWVGTEIEYSGLKFHPERLITSMVFFGIALGLVAMLIAYVALDFSILFSTAAFFVIFLIFFGGILFLIDNVAESKGHKVEKVLPDALQLIASNIKAGLTTERALFVSARPEFSPLSNELLETSKHILGGEKIEDALMRIPKKIKSKVLDRTIFLVVQGIKSGGQIANLLLQLSDDLREENALKSEVKANIGMYVMLIFFSAAFGAPMLFGVSTFIVGVMSSQTENISITPEEIQQYAAQSPALSVIGIPSVGITEEFIFMFSQIMLFFTSVFASLVLGVISTGSEKGGVRFIPIIIVVSFALFYVTRFMVESLFGGMIF